MTESDCRSLFDTYKHQRRQLKRLSQLSYRLLCAIDDNDDDRIEQAYDELSYYMLYETNLAVDYCE
jgi:hypothetical protein